ncbi:dynamin-binding protein-like isoform X2 [Oculina patagonica]
MEGSFARALYAYQSDNPDELSVPEGSIIRITQYINKHWLEASYQGETGLFPVTYAERLKNETHMQNDASTDDELQDNLPSNWQGQNNEFYRQKDFSAKLNSDDGSFVEAAFAFSARNDSELTFPSGALIEVTKDVDVDWLEGSFNGKTGLFPKSYLKSSEKPCARAVYPFVGESVGELTFREGDCIFLRKRLNSQWMEGEIDGKVGLFPSSFVAVEVELPPEQNTFVNGDFNFMNLPSNDGVHNNTVAPKIKWKRGMKGRALFHFTALYSGDLELNKGDVVTVLEVDDDNWIEGQLANGIRGSCPAAYLEPVYDTSRLYDNKSLKARTHGFVSDASFSGIFDDFVSDSGYINTSQKGSSRQQTNNVVDSYTKRDDDAYKHLLDSSFMQDPTPALLPSNMPTTETQETGQRTQPLLKPKPALRTKPTQNYSVTYLGGKDSGELSAPKSYQTNVSPSISMPSLPGRSAPVPSSREMSLSYHSQIPNLHQDSAGTWPGKRAGIHRHIADEKTNRKNFFDDDDLLSGNCTSLPTPLVPLPQAGIDDRNSESSTSEDSPRTPKRPAPPPPKRDSSSKNHARSSTLPATRSKGLVQSEFSREASSSKAKDQQLLDGKDMKQNGRPHTPSPTENKRDFSLSIKGSPKMRRAGESTKPKPLSRPHSVHWKDRDSHYTAEKSPLELRRSNSLETLREVKSSSVTMATGSAKRSDQQSVNKEGTDVPGLAALQERIAEAEENLKKEMKVHTGFKTISQLVMTDPVKQREMEAKVSQSQQKINEWQEELKHLKDEQVFLIESHRKKTLKIKIADLEADLEKQVRSQRSLEMLLGVVEENRKKEVMENLGVCAQLVEKIKRELTELEVSLHSLTEKPAESSQKHMAEQRQRVLTELINTEKDYCNDLELCVKHFLLELQDAQVKDLDCEGLFGNIESVLETSQKLLKSLEDAVQDKEGKDQELGKCFADIAEEMKEVYAVYCRNHDDAISLMEKYEEVPEIQEAFTKCLDKIREHTRCWDLSSFLIKPVQRVLKYPLLLNELLKYTPEIHGDKYNLLKAISVMTDVANAINEFKRRKDLVVKYKKVEDSGLTNKIQKLSWHSVVKKGSRFNQRLTQLTGLVSQTVDEKFIEEEKKFRAVEKTVKTLWKNISTYLEEFQETMECHKSSGQNVSDFYQEAATCSEVSTYQRIQKRIGETILCRFMDSVQVQVLSPLNSLLNLFQGPQRLIQKRNDKCLDYDRWSNKIDKIKDRDKLKAAKEELELAKKNYEALNTQLLEEIPGFTEMCMALTVDCLENFALAQNRLYCEIQQDYDELLQLPVVQADDEDIVEHHSKRSVQVMEQFSDLSFIPCSFVAKDSSRKKRRSLKIPSTPSHDPDAVEDDSETKNGLLNTKEGELGREGGGAKKGPPLPSPAILQPRPAPRRLSSRTSLELKDVDSSQPVEVTPGESKRYVVEFNFEAQNAGELSVSEGDLVSVLRHSDSSGNPEWWLVHYNGASGYIPESYLSPVGDSDSDNDGENDDGDDNTAQDTDRTDTNGVEDDGTTSMQAETAVKLYYCAEFAFEASSAAELSLDEGQLVIVLQRQDLTGNDEWWLVEVNGQKGYVPSSYLTAVED